MPDQFATQGSAERYPTGIPWRDLEKDEKPDTGLSEQELLAELRARWKQLDQNRTEWTAHWKDVRDYLMPHHGFFMNEGDRANDGTKKLQKIFDTRPLRAMDDLAALLQSGLTSPITLWFQISHPDKRLMENTRVKAWFDQVEQQLYHGFAVSDFYGSSHNLYRELAGMGTGCLYVEEDPVSGYFIFRDFTVGEYWAGLNSANQVDTVYVLLPMTPRQMEQKFGWNRLSDKAKQAWEKDPYGTRKVWMVVCPRKDFVPGRLDAKGKPWACFYYEDEADAKDGFLAEMGYLEFPFMFPRWDRITNADTYGRGPGMKALPDVKSVYQISRSMLMGLHKMVDPPMVSPPQYKDRLNLLPGGMNYAGGGLPGDDVIKPILQINFRLDEAQAMQTNKIDAINDVFFRNLFIYLLQTTNRTATEIEARTKEQFLLIGPIINRLQAEFIQPLLDRCFAILLRTGKIPLPPIEVQGTELKWEYVSLLSQAQKLVNVQGIEHLAMFVGNLAQVFPEAVDMINQPAMVSVMAESLGVEGRVIRTGEELEQITQARQKAQQQQMEMAQQQSAIDGLAKLGKVGMNKDDPNAVTALLGGGL